MARCAGAPVPGPLAVAHRLTRAYVFFWFSTRVLSVPLLMLNRYVESRKITIGPLAGSCVAQPTAVPFLQAGNGGSDGP
jgi:hypothetical protein